MILYNKTLTHKVLFVNRGDKMDREKKLTLTVQETAQMLGLSRNSAYQGIATGEIPHVKVGKRILIPLRALEKMLEGQQDADKNRG